MIDAVVRCSHDLKRYSDPPIRECLEFSSSESLWNSLVNDGVMA